MFRDIESQLESAPATDGGDPSIVDEFIRFVREDAAPSTSPVAARYSVATGCVATDCIRNGGRAAVVPVLNKELAAYFTHTTQ